MVIVTQFFYKASLIRYSRNEHHAFEIQESSAALAPAPTAAGNDSLDRIFASIEAIELEIAGIRK